MDTFTASTMSQYPRPRNRLRHEPPPRHRLWSLNVLLVDDDPADSSLILSILKRHPNVSTAHATDAPEFALSQLAQGRLKPDLVLLDIHMPKVDGFTFLKAFRIIPGMAGTPVVFLTTSGLQKDVETYMEGTASSYVIKPENYYELQSRVGGVIRRAIASDWSQ
jgi:two-component system response regulator AdeR